MNILLTWIKKYWIFYTLFILTLITIFSLRPLATLPPVPGTDKIHHFIAYATLMLPTALRKPKYWLVIVLLFIACSGLIELIQPYVNRYCDLKDLLANIAGLACGLIIAEILKRLFSFDAKAS
ncbi:MAG: VanZ family protein [Pleurocapsa sp. SU_5_0]|nr:VanZ family protein [Pleurocapsa sp. SU_5_0]NJO97319.1 VanZ family protein [Pleurocapsa sp. CRU_1_2]NJR46917.1 VanZ family protein [Hyellaceae cyanobacterium CSU_1_1]